MKSSRQWAARAADAIRELQTALLPLGSAARRPHALGKWHCSCSGPRDRARCPWEPTPTSAKASAGAQRRGEGARELEALWALAAAPPLAEAEPQGLRWALSAAWATSSVPIRRPRR